MNLKLLLFETLSFSLVTSFVLASETSDCDEIKEYLENKSFNYTKTIEICNINDQGKVIQLKVNNEDLQEEDVNKILSYNTIKDLEYAVVFNIAKESDTPYSYLLDPHPGYTKFPYAIANSLELEKLNFYYEDIRYVRHYPSVNLTSIEDGTFKSLINLKNLSLSQVNITNENLKELSTLTNLEEIEFIKCSIDSDGFSSFENHENLSKLSISNIDGRSEEIPNHIGKVKSLKEIYIDGSYCGEESYDFSELDNLESLYLGLIEKCNFDLSKNEKLIELSIISHVNYNLNTAIKSPLSLKFPDSLKKLILDELVFSSDNYQQIVSLPNLEELTMNYYYDYDVDKNNSEEFEIKSLESYDKLHKLTIINSNILFKNNEFLNELVNLTYIDISNNALTDIPQLGNFKNLEHIDLSGNRLTKFPIELTMLKNLEYIDLRFNNIDDELPESLSQLENLKYFNIDDNKRISGKVLTNKSLEKCIYSVDDDLCVPKGYELNCLDEKFKLEKTFKTCEEEINVEDNTDDKCIEVQEQEQDLDKDKCLITEEPVTEKPVIEEPVIENPVIENPTTEKPVTEKPIITEKPVTENPTTEKPVTEKPIITEKPTTEKPIITERPTTEKPIIAERFTTEKSTTEKPITGKPVTDKLTTEKPTTEKPVTEKPVVVEKFTTEKPTAVKPTTENPTTLKPTGKPASEESTADESLDEDSSIEKPSPEKPVTEKPVTEKSSTEKPTTAINNNNNSNNESSTTTYSLPYIEGRCGEGYGRCPDGQCCSKYGWCGKSDVYCTAGCKPDFGECRNTDDHPLPEPVIEETFKEKCGEGIGHCSHGYCCSKDGLCGKSYGHCAVSEGCQSTYGICTEDNTSIEGRCGKDYGKCLPGYCCSRYGWCGATDDHCSPSKGCQSEFGICK